MHWPRSVSVVLFSLAAIVTGFSWALASPIGASPDDDFHQVSIWCPPPIEESGCPLVRGPDGSVEGVVVPALVMDSSFCYAHRSDDSAACIEDVRGEGSTTRVDRGEYPGPYYRFMNVFVGEDVERSILSMRAFNVLLAVALLISVGWLAAPSTRRVLVLATLGTFVPLGVFIIASINPSSWAIVGLTTMWTAMHVLFLSRRRGPVLASAAVLLLGAGVAAGSRADVGAYIVPVTFAVALVHLRSIAERPLRLLAPVVACVLGLMSFLSSSQRDALVISRTSQRAPSDVFFKNVIELPGLFAGVFGLDSGLGWLDTRLPAITYVSALVVAGALVILGLRELRPAKVVAVLALVSALVGVPLYIMQGQLLFVGEGVQPRYLLPLITASLGICLVAARPGGGAGLNRGQTVAVYLFLTSAHTFALHANIRRYVTGQDVHSFNLGRDAEWWWSLGPSPMELWAIGSCAFAVVALALFTVEDDRLAVSADLDGAGVAAPGGPGDAREGVPRDNDGEPGRERRATDGAESRTPG